MYEQPGGMSKKSTNFWGAGARVEQGVVLRHEETESNNQHTQPGTTTPRTSTLSRRNFEYDP